MPQIIMPRRESRRSTKGKHSRYADEEEREGHNKHAKYSGRSHSNRGVADANNMESVVAPTTPDAAEDLSSVKELSLNTNSVHDDAADDVNNMESVVPTQEAAKSPEDLTANNEPSATLNLFHPPSSSNNNNNNNNLSESLEATDVEGEKVDGKQGVIAWRVCHKI